MMMFKHSYIFIVVAALSLLLGTTTLYAQSYTLTIQEGRVYVNGKELSQEQIPRSLDTETMNVNLSFTGTPNPTFELDGRYYSIGKQSLREVTRSDNADRDGTTVIFRDQAAGAREARSEAYYNAPQTRKMKEAGDDPNVIMQQYVIELSQNTRQLNEMSPSISQRQAQVLIQQVHSQAEEAARLAQELPYLELQNYLYSVRRSDEALYQRMLNELELERETQRIAAEARALPRGAQRTDKISELREMLGNILELKQKNRWQEIEQLEKQLIILKQRFSEREAKKEQLINNRIIELVGSIE